MMQQKRMGQPADGQAGAAAGYPGAADGWVAASSGSGADATVAQLTAGGGDVDASGAHSTASAGDTAGRDARTAAGAGTVVERGARASAGTGAATVRDAPTVRCPRGAVAVRDAPSARRPRGAVARRLWGALGFIAFSLGAAGAVLPVLPTVPFMLLAAFCFARSSERADAWFRGTRLYATVLESYVERRRLDAHAKLTILVPVTILLGIAAFFMRSITPMLVLFAVVWLGHVVYFGFMVKGEVRP